MSTVIPPRVSTIATRPKGRVVSSSDEAGNSQYKVYGRNHQAPERTVTVTKADDGSSNRTLAIIDHSSGTSFDNMPACTTCLPNFLDTKKTNSQVLAALHAMAEEPQFVQISDSISDCQ